MDTWILELNLKGAPPHHNRTDTLKLHQVVVTNPDDPFVHTQMRVISELTGCDVHIVRPSGIGEAPYASVLYEDLGG